MADQAASLFGSGCFKPSDLKVTMGTGTFVNVNMGGEPHASVAGNFAKFIIYLIWFFYLINICIYVYRRIYRTK